MPRVISSPHAKETLQRMQPDHGLLCINDSDHLSDNSDDNVDILSVGVIQMEIISEILQDYFKPPLSFKTTYTKKYQHACIHLWENS